MARRRSSATRSALFLIVIVLLSVFVASQLGQVNVPLFQSAPLNLNVNTATQTQPQFGYWAGSGWCGGGQNPSVTGENTATYTTGWPNIGEVFDGPQYFISWDPNGGVSEKINVAANIFPCHTSDSVPVFGPGTITAMRYLFEITTDGTNWQPFLNAGPSGPAQGFIQASVNFPMQYFAGAVSNNFQGQTFKILGNQYQTVAGGPMIGIQDGAALRVSVQFQDPTHNGNDYNWYTIAQDIAVLRSGLVNEYWSQTLYHVNDTAQLYWQVPTVTLSGGQTGYYLTITNDNTGQAISGFSYMPITTAFGSVSFKITPDMFVSGGVNQFHAIISSAILNAKSVPVSVRFSMTNGPVITGVQFNQAYYHQGDLVVVSWTAKPDPATSLPILKYRVEADIMGFQALAPQFVGNGTTQVSFNAASTGPLDVFITAYDQYGPGAVYDARSTIGNPTDFCRIYPTAPQCQGGGGGGPPVNLYWLAFLVAGIVALAAAAFLPTDMKAFKVKPFARVILAIAGIMSIGIAYLVFGV